MRLSGRRFISVMLGAFVVASAVVTAGDVARAVTPQEMLADKALEGRAREISAELRCLVCQNQSIDDSDAPLAHDLRVLVRERLTAGDTDQQVLDFIVARYGEFVLLRPPFEVQTLLLWFMPLLALAAAVIILRNSFRASREQTETAAKTAQASALTADEQAALHALLKTDDEKRS